MKKTAKIRVCQLCAVDFTLKQFITPIIDRMTQEGWDVTAVCSDGASIPGLRGRGYKIITTPISRSLNVFSHLRSIWNLFWIFRKEKFDVLHAHTPIAALLGRIAARCAGVPLIIYTAHGFYFHDEMPRFKRHLFLFLEFLGAKFGDLIFTVSKEDAATAVSEGIERAENVLFVGNGVNLNQFLPVSIDLKNKVRNYLGIPPKSQLVGSVGRMVSEKGYPELLRAAERVTAEFPDTYFILVGGRLDSDHNESINSDIKRAKNILGDRLVMPGFKSDISDLIGAMDVFCLPSHREGMPTTIIEAMLMEKPVVATNIRGSRELVKPGETGYLIPTRNVELLAKAICSLLKDPEGARNMGAKGREFAIQFCDESKIVELQINKIKSELLKRDIG